jgi:hypothetical protein
LKKDTVQDTVALRKKFERPATPQVDLSTNPSSLLPVAKLKTTQHRLALLVTRSFAGSTVKVEDKSHWEEMIR